VNIWGKPAENFAMLAYRGKEIFVEASLRQKKWEGSVLNGAKIRQLLSS
jgi:single-stranded DNA-binding protein